MQGGKSNSLCFSLSGKLHIWNLSSQQAAEFCHHVSIPKPWYFAQFGLYIENIAHLSCTSVAQFWKIFSTAVRNAFEILIHLFKFKRFCKRSIYLLLTVSSFYRKMWQGWAPEKDNGPFIPLLFQSKISNLIRMYLKFSNSKQI